MPNLLTEALRSKQERDQQAVQNLVAQQRLQLDRERMAADNVRANAQEKRADVVAQREERFASQQERKNHLESLGALMPFIDPNSPQFNPQMAQQMGALHGLGVTQAPGPEMPGAAPQTPEPGIVGPIDSPEHASALARQEAGARLSPQDGAVMPRVDQAGNEAAQEVVRQQQERDAFTQSLSTFDQRQREHADQLAAYQQSKQFPTLQVTLPPQPGSEAQPSAPLTFDTAAMKRQGEQTNRGRAERYGQIYGDDPDSAKLATSMATLGRPDKEIEDAVNKQMSMRATFGNKWAMANQFQTTADQKYHLGMANAQAHATSANATAAGREDAGAARAQGLLDRALAHSEKVVDWKGLAANEQTLRNLNANLGPGTNALQHKDALIQLARIFRQAQPTEGEMHLLYNKLGGTMDKWNQFVSSFESGDVSPRQLQLAQQSAAAIAKEHEDRKGRAFKSLATQFGPGSGYEMLGPQIDTALKARGEALGLDVPSVYGGQQSGGATVLGSRAKKGASNPLVNAAKASKLPPADRKMLDWANAHPGDPRSKEVHDHLGM